MEQKYVNNTLNELARACDECIEWVENVSEPEVKKLANNLQIKLCKLKNNAAAAHTVLPSSVSIGVFGASQAGKSYMVSTLASKGGGDGLVADWDGQTVSFIKDLNPQGGDREATGIVTRFTHDQAFKCPHGFPASVRVFSETDIVKLLVNSYFADINFKDDNAYLEERNNFFRKLNDNEELFRELEHSDYQLTEGENNYVSEADIVSLAEYVSTHSGETVLKESSYDPDCAFWTKARKKVTSLNLKGRSKLFSALWFYMPAFTSLFEQVAKEVLLLKGASRVFVPLEAFSTKGPNGLVQRDGGTLVDIKVVLSLYSSDDRITVCLDAEGKDTVNIHFPSFGAAVYELTFPLTGESESGSFDVLDFPGARSRKAEDLKIWKTDDGRGGAKDHEGAEFFRRGKVGYLIDKYCIDHEIDVLLCCIGMNAQQEVSLTQYFTDWIRLNVGKDPADRAKNEKSPFVGVFTRSDSCVVRGMGAQASAKSDIGESVGRALERFGVDWMEHWTETEPFKQFFFVRRPNIEPSKLLYKVDDKCTELELSDAGKAQADLFLNEIIKDEKMRHVYKFEETQNKKDTPTINELLKPNDGGVGYLAKFLKDEFTSFHQIKDRSLGIISDQVAEIENVLGMFCQKEGASAAAAAQSKAHQAAIELMQCEKVGDTMSYIRRYQEIDQREAEDDYLSNSTSGSAHSAFRFAQELTKMHQRKLNDIKEGACFERMAAVLCRSWLNDELPGVEAYNEELRKKEYSFFLNPDGTVIKSEKELKEKFKNLINYYVTELEKAYSAFRIEERIKNELEKYENGTSGVDSIYMHQVECALQIISDFNTYLLSDTLLEEQCNGTAENTIARVFNSGLNFDNNPVYRERIEEHINHMPNVTSHFIDNLEKCYLSDFFSVFENVCATYNLTAKSRFTITPEENVKLFELLEAMKKHSKVNA